MHILVFTDSFTKRAEYIIKHILGNMLGLNVRITQRNDDLKNYNGPKLSYSSKAKHNEDAVCVEPHGLLNYAGVTEQSIEVYKWRSLPAFFSTNPDGQIPFDIFAASFYLLSRYEEYFPGNMDEHGRFPYSKSVAFKNNFLDIPLVDLWVRELGQIISEKFPQVEKRKRAFNFMPTIDIDNAFAFKHKGLARSILATAKSLFLLNLSDLYERFAVYSGRKSDPFDTYQELFRILKNHPQAIWFFLGGKYGKYDKHISPKKKAMQRIVKDVDKRFNVGVHPSYGSGVVYERVKSETDILSAIIERMVTQSRQHFLRVQLPQTYHLLSAIDITEDYSMGYSNAIGFRASTCTPYPFFDLLNNEVLPIKMVPFQVMDRALLQGLNLTAQEAVNRTLDLAIRVKEVGGEFVTVWHNESLSGINEWEGWSDVFATVVNELEKLSS
ncbi:MAG: polysaccharide deacetylase family protein [Bacteroidales bacterium]